MAGKLRELLIDTTIKFHGDIQGSKAKALTATIVAAAKEKMGLRESGNGGQA